MGWDGTGWAGGSENSSSARVGSAVGSVSKPQAAGGRRAGFFSTTPEVGRRLPTFLKPVFQRYQNGVALFSSGLSVRTDA